MSHGMRVDDNAAARRDGTAANQPPSTMIAVGIDAGSTTFKAVGIDASGEIVASLVEPAEPRVEAQARRALDALRAGSGEAVPVGATGYGRKLVRADVVLTEITCHARGAFARLGRPGLLIDMGGQDTKAIRLGPAGEVLDFVMNDRCAAGTGRFLEVILSRLGVPLEDVSAVAARASAAVAVSSTCTVFAESEVVSLVANGTPVESIVRGLHEALARRVASLAGPLATAGGCFMSGGVALNASMVRALEAALDMRVEVVPDPQLTGALGAALSAAGAEIRGPARR